MAEINQRERYVRIKIVYYGPPLGGKTTNLKVLHRRAFAHRRGEMISINSMQDRTILFDLLPLTTAGSHGFEVRLQLVAVPGQAQYAVTRRAALKGADGVAFVANSAADRFEENLQSFRELSRYLMDQGLDPFSIPLAFQYNKRDLPEVTPIEALDSSLKTRKEPAHPAVATTGEGVIETFEAILGRTFAELSRRYRVLALDKGQSPQAWAAQAVANLFGRALRENTPAPCGASPGEELEASLEPSRAFTLVPEAPARTIRVATGDGSSSARGAKGPSETGGAYAEAAAELAVALAQVSAERDLARRWLDDVRRTLAAAQRDGDRETRVRRMLSCLAEAAGAAHASFVWWSGERLDGACTLPPFGSDPLLGHAAGVRFLTDLAKLGRPHLEASGEYPEVVALLGQGRPPLQALAAVPVGRPGALAGLALLYFIEGDALPSSAAVEHLCLLASLCEARIAQSPAEEELLLDEADLVSVSSPEPERRLRLAVG